jgi:hypothetical protein
MNKLTVLVIAGIYATAIYFLGKVDLGFLDGFGGIM